MSNPKVSIIIPVYNGQDFVAEAIESALAQTYQNREIIVVNDGSTDGGATEKTVAAYLNQVHYYSKPNGGVASALNFAIERATGDYISWLSHDDLYTPDKLEKQMQALSLLDKNTILYSDFSIFQDDVNAATPVSVNGVASAHFRHWLTMKSSLHGCTLLIPKEAFTSVGLFDERLKTTQDYFLWFRMAEKYAFTYLPGVLVKSRHHEAQGTRKMSAIVVEECNALLSGFVEALTPEEIVAASGKSLYLSYEEMALSMERRGYHQAATIAQHYAIQHYKGMVSYRLFRKLRKISYLLKTSTSSFIRIMKKKLEAVYG